MHPPPTVPRGTPLSLVIGSTLGKSLASKPLLSMTNAWHSLFTPVFHLNSLLLSASSKMLFASAKNFLPLLGPSVLQIAPWQSWEAVAKCHFALTLVFHCLETWQGFLYFFHIPPQVLPHPPGTPSPDYLPFSLSSTQLHLQRGCLFWAYQSLDPSVWLFPSPLVYYSVGKSLLVKTNIYTYWIAMKINLIIILSYLLFIMLNNCVY